MYGKNYKMVARKADLETALGEAFSEIESLRDEMEEWKSSLEGTNFEQTERYSRIEEAQDTLDDALNSQPDVPDSLAGLEVEWHEGVKKSKRRGPSRAARLGNASNAIGAVIDLLTDKDSEDPDAGADETTSLLSQLEEIRDNIDGVEFPGMFG
jgi:chromosome segregation ATPase